jgi:glycoprotein-N-acetylgalactosamine 3-beta-galactosyltransferase
LFSFSGDRNDTFHSGGAGYTLNKAALKLLVVYGLPQYYCHDKLPTEDLLVARIFRQLGVYPYDTKDETGGERYLNFPPRFFYNFYKNNSADFWYHQFSMSNDNGDVKYGMDHCAARSVSFHYIRGDELKRFHAILYHLCPNKNEERER